MAGLKLTIDNWTNETPTVLKQQNAGTTVGVDLDGDWASYNSATAVWRLFGPSNHVPPPVLVEPAGAAGPHLFQPKMCGRYVAILHIETNSGDKNRFSAVYEVDAPQAAQALPSPQERDEYNNETGWSTSVEHFLRLHLKELGGRKVVAIQNVSASAIAEGSVCAIRDIRSHADSAEPTDSALGSMENMMLTVIATNSTVASIEYASLAYCLQPLSAFGGGNDRGYAVVQGHIPFDITVFGAGGPSIGDLLYVSQSGELIPKSNAMAEGNGLRPVARVIDTGNGLVGTPAATPGVILFEHSNNLKTASATSHTFEGGTLVDGYIPTYNSAGDFVQWRSPENAVTGVSVASAATTANTMSVWDSADGTLLRDTELYVDVTDGKLGIGVTSPGEKLEVDGNIVTQKLIGSTGNTLTVTTPDSTGDTRSVTITAGIAGEAGQPGDGGNINILGGRSSGTGDAGNCSVLGGMGAAGGDAGHLVLWGGLAIGGGDGGNVKIDAGGGTPDGNVLISTVTSGNVGIGTDDPAVALDVIGTGSFAGAASSLSQGNVQVGVDSGGDPGGELMFHTDDYVGLRCADSGAVSLAVKPSGNVGVGTTAPAQKLHVNGSMAVKYRNITATGAVSDDDYVIGVGTRAAQVDITLPLSVDSSGRMLIIKDEACEAANVGKNIKIQAQGSEEVVDAATGSSHYMIQLSGQSITLYSNGTDWFII